MDTDAHTRKPHASRASTRQIATRTHVDSRDPTDAHVRKGTTKKDGWGKKVYEGHECDSGRARAALLRMERETTLPRSSTRRRVSSESSGDLSARVSVTSSSPPAPTSPSHRAILPRSLTRVPAMFVLEARANAELAAEARRVSAAWAKVKSTVATNRADAARRLTLLAAKDAERGESLFLTRVRAISMTSCFLFTARAEAEAAAAAARAARERLEEIRRLRRLSRGAEEP
jgi:hypothetical protein